MEKTERTDINKRINCHKCSHYYVTWEKKFPHGCRAMKFKSRQQPAAAVEKNSGMPCMMFKGKIANERK
jgi:hypothetical protein